VGGLGVDQGLGGPGDGGRRRLDGRGVAAGEGRRRGQGEGEGEAAHDAVLLGGRGDTGPGEARRGRPGPWEGPGGPWVRASGPGRRPGPWSGHWLLYLMVQPTGRVAATSGDSPFSSESTAARRYFLETRSSFWLSSIAPM